MIVDFFPVPDGSFNINKTYQLASGDDVTVFIFVFSEDDSGTERIKFTPTFTLTIESNDISIPINIEDLIGDTKRIDFVKDVMQRFGLIIRPVRNENEYEFIQMKTLLSDFDNAEDWSDKYSDEKNQSYKSGYAQKNNVKYKYDSTDSNIVETFGDGEMLITDVNLAQEKPLFTSIFKASKFTNDLYILNHWILNDDIEPNQDGLRIFKINITSDTIQFKYDIDTVSSSSFTGSIPFLNFDLINYQKELDNNYVEVNVMLNEYKMFDAEINLDTLDIYNLDFFKLKFIKQLNGYFYLNKVKSYKENKITTVELIKARNISQITSLMDFSYQGSSDYDIEMTKIPFGFFNFGYQGSSDYAFNFINDAGLTQFLGTTVEVSSIVACSETTDVDYWHDGAGAIPAIGDIIYIDASGTTVLNGSNLYISTSTGDWLRVNVGGIVTDKGICV